MQSRYWYMALIFDAIFFSVHFKGCPLLGISVVNFAYASTLFLCLQIENVDGESIFSAIIHIIEFIYRSLCFKNGAWMQSFGKLTWPRMSELIITNFLSKVCFPTVYWILELLVFLILYVMPLFDVFMRSRMEII